jgi:hypothetical protein
MLSVDLIFTSTSIYLKLAVGLTALLVIRMDQSDNGSKFLNKKTMFKNQNKIIYSIRFHETWK